MNVLPYIGILLTSTLLGAGVGFLSGWSLGWYFALGYHKHGPSDPADAPAMVAIGLMFLGACLGAIVGLVIGTIFCVHLARRKRAALLAEAKS
jgi:ABC-type antimicrobial peptide transport system permease subunit